MVKVLLLVEDDPFISSLLKVRFNSEGFTVLYAADGEAALIMLRQEKPDF